VTDTHIPSETLTLTSKRGCDFDISPSGDEFMLGMTPVAEPSTWMCIDAAQATALRDWLNKALP
jgi:hypothetical protein